MAGGHSAERTAPWSAIAPGAAAVFIAAKYAGLIASGSGLMLVVVALLLAASVFAAVHHAEVIALRVGEPFGSILLAVAVTVIEVALIVSILLTDTPGSETVARDTVYATIMVVLNGVVGFCLILGGWKHREQSFRIDGAAATLAVLGTLAVFALILPNYTLATHGPSYSSIQLGVVGAASLALYIVFVLVQTVTHREYFLDGGGPAIAHAAPSTAVATSSAVLLVVSLVAVVLLSKVLSYPLEKAILSAGLPRSFLGVIIATVVLLPEGIASLRAALGNRLQSSINLALGSAVASIGLTIPVVALASLWTGRTLVLGLDAEYLVLLVLTLFASTLTLGTGRTTFLQGFVHVVVFAIFLLLSAIP